jgi:hypothetical protein
MRISAHTNPYIFGKYRAPNVVAEVGKSGPEVLRRVLPPVRYLKPIFRRCPLGPLLWLQRVSLPSQKNECKDSPPKSPKLPMSGMPSLFVVVRQSQVRRGVARMVLEDDPSFSRRPSRPKWPITGRLRMMQLFV